MVLSIYGILVLAVGALLLVFKRPLREFVALLLVCGVLGAAEAMALPMLGGSSLTVPYFCVFVVFVRLLFTAKRYPGLVREALQANKWLIAFTAYGVASAFIMPRLLEGQMSVFAMRSVVPYRTLLTFTSQNITQSVYMILTVITAIAAYITARSKKGDEAFFLGWSAAAGLFVLFGFIDLLSFYGGSGEVLGWLKTASYAMLSQSEGGIRRISGSFSEPSAFAGFGASPAMFFAFLWLVNFKSTVSGVLALCTAALLALSTSTAAFVSLALLVLVVCFSIIFTPLPTKVRRQKFISLCVAAASFTFILLAIGILLPDFANKFLIVAEDMTVNKMQSQSAIERGAWAAQGIEAFKVSNGIGIGVGSFRSSGAAHAIVGSTGIVGSICFLMYFISICRAAFSRAKVDRRMFVACAFATILMTATPFMVSPSPDLGIFFGAMAGFTLGKQKQAIRNAWNLQNASPGEFSRRGHTQQEQVIL